MYNMNEHTVFTFNEKVKTFSVGKGRLAHISPATDSVMNIYKLVLRRLQNPLNTGDNNNREPDTVKNRCQS